MARQATKMPEPPVEHVFEICVHGRPVSAQTARRQALQAWKDHVRTACKVVWAGKAPIKEAVTVRVTHYCEAIIGDVDNLMKPIQDALQGIVYSNDRQVSDTHGNRRNIANAFVVRYISMPLAAAFSDGSEFVHIRVSLSPKRESLG